MLEQRPYQQRIISKAVKAYREEDASSVMIESPPGSGKTIMSLSIVKQLFEHSEELFDKSPEDVQVGWVAMRRNLLAQAEAENLKVRCPNVHYISMFSSDPPPVDVLVIDEAHHDAAASCANIHNICQPKVSLGLTATPYRTDRMKLCFNKVIKDAGFHLLIEDGFLSKFDQWMIPDWSAEQVVKTFMEKPEEWGKSVMFFLTIAECQKAANLLQKQGITCEVVTGSSNREQQISDFIKGKVQVLLNVYVLCEGFDCCDMKTVFVRDSSRGPTIQMAGRVLRKHPDVPVANIVQSVRTRYPFTRTASPNRQYLYQDGSWREVGESKMVQVMSRFMLNRVMNAEVHLPGMLRKHKVRRFR